MTRILAYTQSNHNFVLQLKPATRSDYSTQLKHVAGFICKTKLCLNWVCIYIFVTL